MYVNEQNDYDKINYILGRMHGSVAVQLHACKRRQDREAF